MIIDIKNYVYISGTYSKSKFSCQKYGPALRNTSYPITLKHLIVICPNMREGEFEGGATCDVEKRHEKRSCNSYLMDG